MVDAYPERQHIETAVEESRNDRHILVVGFTKEAAYQFVKIRQHTDKSIYVKFPYRNNRGPHYSYHANGRRHLVRFNEKGRQIHIRVDNGLPISKFKGQVRLESCTIILPESSSGWRKLTVAEERRTQAMFCFDMSRLGRQLNISCYLLETGRVDLLPAIVKAVPPQYEAQFLVITTTNPWIVIQAMPL